MKVIAVTTPGGPEVLRLIDAPEPVAGANEVVLEVAATAVNRADLLQRQGFYPPPPGAPQWPGLEASGTISFVGPGVNGWSVGDRACALLSGGGYAEKVVVPAGQLLPVPAIVGLVDAAALPEAVCTVWSNVFMLARLQPGDWLLMHGGSSGIGTMAIQLAHALGARVAVTAGSSVKLERCRELGADCLIDYHHQDFVEAVHKATNGNGADVVLDIMGAKYLARNIEALAVRGRIVVIGMQGGAKGEIDLRRLLAKRGALHATALRAQSVTEKASIVANVRERVWPLVESGIIKPVIHTRLPLQDAAEAHRIVESSLHIGKVLLTV